MIPKIRNTLYYSRYQLLKGHLYFGGLNPSLSASKYRKALFKGLSYYFLFIILYKFFIAQKIIL